MSLDVPKSFKDQRKKDFENKIDKLKQKLAKFQDDNDCVVQAVLASDATSIRSQLMIFPKSYLSKKVGEDGDSNEKK